MGALEHAFHMNYLAGFIVATLAEACIQRHYDAWDDNAFECYNPLLIAAYEYGW